MADRPKKSRDAQAEPTPQPEAPVVHQEVDGAGMGMGMGMGRGGGPPLSLKDLRTFNSFRNPVFRLYYAAMLGQMAAMNMQMMARALLIFHLTGSATILGIMALGGSLPMLLFSLFGGVLADRVQKKYVLLAGQGTSAVISLGIALALTFGILAEDRSVSWLILVAASAIQGTVMGLMMPSRQAMLAEIVGEEQLMNAVALNTLGSNLFRLLAPALAGFLIAAYGFQSVYYIMTGLYLVALGFTVPMPHTGSMAIQGRGALQDIRDGFQYVKSDRLIFMILAVTLVTVLLSMPYMHLLPVFEDVLDIGPRGIGLLISLSGVGAMIGSVILASLPNKRRGMLLMVGSMVLGAALLAFSFSTIFFLSLVIMIFVGLGQTARMTLGNTLIQYYVKDEYRGRVMSIYMMEFGLTSFAVFLAGILADSVGVDWAIGGMAALLVIVSAGVLVFSPRIRNLD